MYPKGYVIITLCMLVWNTVPYRRTPQKAKASNSDAFAVKTQHISTFVERCCELKHGSYCAAGFLISFTL
jgi:hypothetical protein